MFISVVFFISACFSYLIFFLLSNRANTDLIFLSLKLNHSQLVKQNISSHYNRFIECQFCDKTDKVLCLLHHLLLFIRSNNKCDSIFQLSLGTIILVTFLKNKEKNCLSRHIKQYDNIVFIIQN